MRHLLRSIFVSVLSAICIFVSSAQGGDDKTAKAQTKEKESVKRIPGLSGEDAEMVAKINGQITAKWQENKLTPSARSSDYEFIRRATLDLVGRIARPDEINTFFKDPESARRALLVDRLLKHPDYSKHWANIWTVWTMTRNGSNDPNRALYHEQMHYWLKSQFDKENMSFKDLVSDLLTAEGKTNSNGAVNFILSHLGESSPAGQVSEFGQFNMVPVTSRTTRLFLGLQIQCAQCHPHPFNKEWTQRHFWGINAFFRQVERKGQTAMRPNMAAPQLELVENTNWNKEGLVLFEQRNGTILSTRPIFLAKDSRPLPTDVPRRRELARLITESEYFPKSYANRMWGHFFGRGFTNPIDDFSPENEPSHPELLDELASGFKHYGYDPRRLMRWICNSDAYGLDCTPNKTNGKSDAEPFFSRMLLKSMTPEQLFESLMLATQAEKFQTAEQIKNVRRDWMRRLSTNFGDDEGNEVSYNGTVVQALMMMNGSDLNNVIGAKDKGTVALAFMLAKKSPEAVIRSLYLSSLNRPPSSKEMTKILDIYRKAPVRSKDGLSFWQDVLWALLNSNEFILNH